MELDREEEKLLRSVALQNSRAVMVARERAERELIQAKEALERKAEELAQQREWFQVTLSSIGDAVITTDTQGKVTFLNPIAETMTGWKMTDAVGHPLETVFKIVNETSRQPVDNPIAKVLREGNIVGLANHTALIAKDGRETAIEDSAAPIRNSKGEISGAVMVFHNVTERRGAEVALRRSEKLLSDFFENAAVGLHWVGPDGIILRANRAELELLGYSEEEYVGHHISEFHADAPVISDILNKLTCGETLHSCAARLLTKDGSIKHVLISSNVLWENGKFIHTRCFTRDISEQKRAEETLRKESERLHLAMSAGRLGDWTWNASTDIVTLSDRAADIFGLPHGATITWTKMREILHEEDREPARLALEKALADHSDYNIEYRVTHPSGALCWIASKGLGTYRDDGSGTGMIGVVQDITDQKESEENMRRSEERLRTLANSIPQLAWMAEPDGHIFWYNDGWYNYTGTTLAEMEGWGWEKVHDPKMLPLVTERWNESLRTGQPFEMEFPLRGADGVFRWFLTRVNPMRDSEGRVVRWFGTNTNVDEVRRTREALLEETRVLELLNDTGAAIASKLDLQSLVQTVTDSATQLTGAKFGALFYNVINEQGESFLLYTLSGAPREAFEKFGLPRNTPVFNPTFRGEGVMRSGDITKDPRYGTMSPHHGMPKGHLPVRSYLAVPVISRSGEVLGGLFFGHPEADIFTERSERLAVGVAAQAAVAIDNARLYDAAQKEIAERKKAEEALAQRVRLTALRAEVSADLARSDDLRVVLKRCTDALVKHVDACFARIWTVNAAENFLELQASSGIYTHLDGPHGRVKMGQFKIGRIAENRQPHLTNDVQNDPNISDPDWARREGMVGFAGYPLMVESRVVGVIALFARQPFTEELLKELLLMADGLAQWIQRKQAEQALHEAQEKLSRHAEDLENQVTERTSALRETIGELEAFSYSISHDMRAPLRAMQSFALILAEDYALHLDANGKEYIRRITTAAERMDRLIQDVLTYSRIARTDLPLVPIDVEKLIKDILISYPAFQAPAAEIQVEGEFPRVLGLEAVLTQCISNLLGNAVKFVPPGGPPRVRVWAETMPNGATVRILFKDNGVGIEKDAHERIFVMFQRLSKSYEGTGIGLAIVKKGAERVSGTVGLESEPGRGSTFWLELKRADAPRK